MRTTWSEPAADIAQKSITLSVGTPLCLYDITYRRALWIQQRYSCMDATSIYDIYRMWTQGMRTTRSSADIA